ncbi:winged helix-turn-helix domain-containing protein [Comamonas humi]
MVSTASLAETASLIGDLARASMLAALMDGRALTAAELAQGAGITPQTASGHLAKLTQAGLLSVEKQGRHRYHRIASPAVARLLENLMSVSIERDDGASPRGPKVVTGPRDQALRYARTCYDHLAGEVGVAITERMLEAGHIELTSEAGALTQSGARFLQDLGVAVDTGAPARRGSRRVFCRPCLDWSERRLHIAGALGASLFQHYLAQHWIRRNEAGRSVSVTPEGHQAFARIFGLHF